MGTNIESYVDDITLCPICMDYYNDPRSLPCLHTFCLQCLKSHFRNRAPRQEVQCPLCRNKIILPDDGIDGFKRNFFIQGLIAAARDLTVTNSKRGIDFQAILENNLNLLLRCLVVTSTLRMRLGRSDFFRHKLSQIDSQTTPAGKTEQLLTLLSTVTDSTQQQHIFDRFLFALREDDQEHVANIFRPESDARPMTDKHYQILHCKHGKLCKFIDPTIDLLSELMTIKVFSNNDVGRVRSKVSHDEMSRELLDILLHKSDSSFQKFIEALNKTEQQHVVHILTGQGESPLSRVRRLVLRKARKKLISRVDTLCSSLLAELISSGVLTDVDKQRIDAHTVNESRVGELTDIIARKSQLAYDKFLKALKDSGHQGVAEELQGLELRGRIDPNFLSDTSPLDRNIIVKVVRDKMNALVTGTKGEIDLITNLMEQNGFAVSEISEGSIIIRFRCFTKKSLVNLKRLYSGKTLDKLFTQVFCHEYSKQGLQSLALCINDAEFERCEEKFRRASLYPHSWFRQKQLVYNRKLEQINNALQIVRGCKEMIYSRLDGKHNINMHSLPYELHEMLLIRTSCLMAKKWFKADAHPDVQVYTSLSSVCGYFHFILSYRRPRSPRISIKQHLKVACQPYRLRLRLLTRIVGSVDQCEPVRGLCVLNNKLYVTRQRSTAINIYTSHHPYALLRNIQTRFSFVNSIASCNTNQCVYVAGHDTGRIRWVDRVREDGKIVQWLSDIGNTVTLSVTADGRITVLIDEPTGHNRRNRRSTVVVYNSSGIKLTILKLPREIVNPWHVVQTVDKSFVVCHGDINTESNRVCKVNSDGFIVAFHGGLCGSEQGQLDTPLHMALDETEYVTVVDCGNQRVLLLDRHLNIKRVLLTWSDVNSRPCVCHRTKEGLLLVGLYSGDVEIYSASDV